MNTSSVWDVSNKLRRKNFQLRTWPRPRRSPQHRRRGALFIPDASRRPPPTLQDFGCIIKFPLRVIQRNLSEGRWGVNLCNVVWFQNLQSLWWSSQLGESNVHVLLGAKLRDLGASWLYREAMLAFCGWCWSQVGLGYGRSCWSYMSDFVRLCCWVVFQNAPLRHQDFKWVLASYVESI